MTTGVAVTGAGGYVGGRACAALAAAGVSVRPMVRTPVPWVDALHVVDLAAEPVERIAEAFEGLDSVVHLAGSSEVAAARDSDGSIANTVAATRRVAEAARLAGASRLVLLSTIHVYGSSTDGGVVTEDVLPQPRHPYSIARLAGEHVAASVPDIDLVVLRLTNSVGPPIHLDVDRWTLVANELCAQAAGGGPLVLRSSGQQWRDFVDLSEVVRVIASAATGSVPAGTYNLGSGRARTVRSVADRIAVLATETLGREVRVEAPPHEGPAPEAVRVDVSRLAGHVAPPHDEIDDALRATIELCVEGPPGVDEGRG